jgi:hypothetical protein
MSTVAFDRHRNIRYNYEDIGLFGFFRQKYALILFCLKLDTRQQKEFLADK